MAEHKVPVQSLIDHIKTAVDVDQWAKDMAEELLKEQEAKEQLSDAVHETAKQFRQTIVRCKDCVHWIPGKITDKDDFIQHRCERNGGGWLSDDYCSCAEKRTDKI